MDDAEVRLALMVALAKSAPVTLVQNTDVVISAVAKISTFVLGTTQVDNRVELEAVPPARARRKARDGDKSSEASFLEP